MRINVYGLGYVGCVSATCLANAGHTVTGIDIDPIKVSLINDAKSPIIEPGLEEAIGRAVCASRLSASLDGPCDADVSLICVGTPSNENGSLQLGYVIRVAEQIADYLRTSRAYHVVNVRSTILPGTIENTLIPLIENRSQRKVGEDFGFCMNPEFMREGTSLSDFYHPPFTVIGEWDRKSGDTVARLYEEIDAPLIKTTLQVAEMLKYACNAFHALKVSFANEIGNLCKKLGIDSHELMEIFCADRKLNLSPYYLKPGFAFGGSCLPKDLRALIYQFKQLDLDPPVLSSILQSNRAQIDVAYDLVKKTGKKKVGLLGLSFKPGSDDLRESPIVELVEKLIGKGYFVSVYDREVALANLFGSNKRYIDAVIPHISSLMKEDIQAVIENAEVIIVAKHSAEFCDPIASLNGERIILDLVRLMTVQSRDRQGAGGSNLRQTGSYEGICW